MGYGNDGHFAINFQNSFGTVLTSSPYFMPILQEGMAFKKEPLISGEMRGIFEEGDTYEGKNTVEGNVQVDADIVSLAVQLKAFMGSPTTVVSGSLNTMQFEPRQSDFDENCAGNPITVEKFLGDTGSAHIYSDLNASNWELNIANGDFVKSQITFMGGKFERSAKSTATFPTDLKYLWDAGSFSLGGAGNAEMLAFTLTCDDNLENRFAINGSKYPSHIKRAGFRTIRISGTMLFNNQNEFDEWLGQTERAMRLTLTSAVEVQSGYNESIDIQLPKYRYETFEPLLTAPGQIEVGFAAHGKYHTGSGTGLKVTLTTTYGGIS